MNRPYIHTIRHPFLFNPLKQRSVYLKHINLLFPSFIRSLTLSVISKEKNRNSVFPNLYHLNSKRKCLPNAKKKKWLWMKWNENWKCRFFFVFKQPHDADFYSNQTTLKWNNKYFKSVFIFLAFSCPKHYKSQPASASVKAKYKFSEKPSHHHLAIHWHIWIWISKLNTVNVCVYVYVNMDITNT